MTVGQFIDWFTTDVATLGAAALGAAVIYFTVIVMTRLAGVRSFAKISGFDFAMTIAVGAVLASTAMSASVPVGVAVLGMLSLIQWGLSRRRGASGRFSETIDNQPILVMAEGEILTDSLARSGVTRGDLMGKLRETNAIEMRRVRAVVVETTGDVSVLHGDPEVPRAPELLEGVKDRSRLLEPDAEG
ncbi:MAG: YetF domain-containing protein [Planctomycetota bacterium]